MKIISMYYWALIYDKYDYYEELELIVVLKCVIKCLYFE